MKKHFAIKPFLIAAAVAVTGAVSAVSAGAAENTNISDLVLPGEGAVNINITDPADEDVQYVLTDYLPNGKYENADADPEVTPDISYYFGNDTGIETEPAGGNVINLNIDRETFTKAAFDFLCKYHELHKDERSDDFGFMGCNHLTNEVFYNTTCNEFNMLYEDGDGVRYYENSDGEKVSVTPITINNEVVIYFMDNAVPEGDLPTVPAVIGYAPADE